MSQIVSWIHFGDLHIAGRDEQNYCDFLSLISETNRHMSASIDFALLPGDNADDGEEDEYQLVREALDKCRFPVHAITGDHDVVPGTLDLFRRYLADSPYRSFVLAAHRFVLLNSVAHWHPPVFGLGDEQLNWLRNELHLAHTASERIVVFMHAYPSQHGTDAAEIRHLLRDSGVLLVEMGHTHYNELANDGRVLYAATRSTGQIEEGPAGFSVTTLDDGVVSWKFKPVGEWPLVMVTSPADKRLIIDPASPAQVVRGPLQVRARVWGPSIQGVTRCEKIKIRRRNRLRHQCKLFAVNGGAGRFACSGRLRPIFSHLPTLTLSVDGGEPVAMEALDACTWGVFWNPEHLDDGPHSLTVNAGTSAGHSADDRVTVHVNRWGDYTPPARQETDYANAMGAWAEKHILGSQLGPNENGHPWPPRQERAGVGR